MMRAMLFVAVMFREEEVLARAQEMLERTFGVAELRSDVFEFNFTRYYEAEFGNKLRKLFLGFGEIEMDALMEAKLRCMEIECALMGPDGRRVNLDPGYVTLHSVVLSTRKPRAHRIYLGRGVFAEVTLLYRRGKYRPLPWTYADYRSEEAQRFFLLMRRKLKGMQIL